MDLIVPMGEADVCRGCLALDAEKDTVSGPLMSVLVLVGVEPSEVDHLVVKDDT